MEKSDRLLSGKTKKRKASEEADAVLPFPFDELSQDLLEKVLSCLPTSTFLRMRSVCKRWSSVAASATFLAASAQVPFRDPWFVMVDQDLNQSVIFDSSEGNWKNLNPLTRLNETHQPNSIPVASHGGLVCFRDTVGGFAICNPVTGARRTLPCITLTRPLLAVSMSSLHMDISSSSSYKIVLLTGEFSNISFTTFNSDTNQWEEEVTLARKEGNSKEEAVYFLSKSGEVVAANMQRSPSKEFSSVNDGKETILFLNHTGAVTACNLNKRVFHEYPRLLPVDSEYSIDIVVCKGEMMVVVLTEFLETARLSVWRFSETDRSWRQAAAMPPWMSHEFYGKKADINCVACGDVIFVCLNSGELSMSVIYNVVASEWVELPKCVLKGEVKEFVSALSFEPRVEVSV